MSTEPINYEAVIADLEAKKHHLEVAIAAMRALAGMGSLGSMPTPPSGPSGAHTTSNGPLAPDAFFGKSIPEAAAMILGSARKKMSTQALMDAMEAGGLPRSKYNTVYSILRRRESQVGDIINMQGEWGLAAWYPNHTKKPAKKEAVSLNPKTFDGSADEGPDEDAEYEASLERDIPA